MTDYTPQYQLPMPGIGNKVADEASAESIRWDIRKLAQAVARELEVMDAEAAEALATKAGGMDPRLGYYGTNADVIFAELDSEGHSTWVEASAEDGGPTVHSMRMIGSRTGQSVEHDPDALHVFTDSRGTYTDLAVRASDGQFYDFVVDRLAPRVAQRIGGVSAGSGDRYVRGPEVLPVATDMSRVIGWGSSSMEGIGSQLGATLAGVGAAFANQGKRGEQSTQILARMGVTPAKITVTGGSIPASGAVTVTASIPWYQLKPYVGTLAGVEGTLSSESGAFTFTRTTPGAAVSVAAGTEFIPKVGPEYRDAVNLLWAGKNDAASDWAGTVARTDAAFDWLAPLVRRSLVLGHFVDRDDTVGSAEYEKVVKVNAAHKARYGNLFVDVRAYLASAALWEDTGLTPTDADRAAQSAGIKPPSVSQDSGHLNAAGYAGVTKFIFRHITGLGWY